MPLITGRQIKDEGVGRDDLNITTVGQSVIRKAVEGTGISLTSTGADAGTGDVTVALKSVPGLTPGSFTNTNLTVDAYGRVTAAASGSGGGSGSTSLDEVEINFGWPAVRSKVFTITDAAVTPTTKIVAFQAGAAPTGKNADDNEMDTIVFRAYAKSGSFDLYADVVEGYFVGGHYKVHYLRG